MTGDSKEPRPLQMRVVQLVDPETGLEEEYCLQYRSPFGEGKWVTVPVVTVTDPEMYRWVKEGQDV